MEESTGNVLGFKASGKITPTDYEELVPAVEKLIKKMGNIRMLIDLEEFESESVKAWSHDFKFGHEFHDKIDKMAIVGDKKWEEWLTALVDPFYAREAQYFHVDDINAAWDWLSK
jgi:hypothetical protein